MRLRDMYTLLNRIAPALLLVGLLATTGCETKSWMDQTEMMRTSKQPLMIPVLKQLDPRDEVEPEFVAARDVRQSDLISYQTDYVIGPNDVVSISITEVAGPSIESVKTARVSESGNVSLPLIGQIKASGKTDAELEKAVAEEYRNRNLIQNAQVSVTVLEPRGRTFSALGLFGRPGQYQIVESDFRLLQAMTLTGDIQFQGLEYVYIIRKKTPPGGTTQPAQTQPATPDQTQPQPQPRPGVDPLEGKPQGALSSEPRQVVASASEAAGRPVLLMQDAAGSAPEEGAPRKVLIDGQWKEIKPGEKVDPAAPGAPAPTAPGDPLRGDNAGSAGTTAGAGAGTNSGTSGTGQAGDDASRGSMDAGKTETGAADGGFEFEAPQADPNVEIIRIPVERLQRGQLEYNVVIRPNDLLMAPSPRVGEYYIGGHVGRPGVYSLTGRDITLKQAIIAAGMLDPLAWPERTEIIRRIGKDRELFLRINLPKLWAGEESDFYLRPYDTVQVGTNALVPFIAAARGAFRITYGFGFIYDRNFAYDNNSQFR